MPNAHVFDLAKLLLNTVIDIYADLGILLPERRAVVEGPAPAFDCESTLVHVQRVFRGLPGQAFAGDPTPRCAGMRTAEMHVWILRCTSGSDPDGQPPPASEMESFAEPILIDAWVLPTQLQERALNNSMGYSCDDIFMGDCRVLEPSGRIGGVELTVEWQLGA